MSYGENLTGNLLKVPSKKNYIHHVYLLINIFSFFLRKWGYLIIIFARKHHCVKSVCARSYSGSYFPAFGLNTERYSVSLHIQSKCGKVRTTITSNRDTFYAVLSIHNLSLDSWLYYDLIECHIITFRKIRFHKMYYQQKQGLQLY